MPRISLRYDAIGATARLTIDATPRTSSTTTQDNDRLMVKFDADGLDVPNPPLPPQPAGSLVQAVRFVEPTALVVELGPRFGSFRVTSASGQPTDGSIRTVIDVVSNQTETAPAPPGQPPGGAPPPAGAPPATGAPPSEPPPFAQTPAVFRTVVIDPGHGGEDEGVRASNGAKEKDLTLAIGRRLKNAVEGRLGVRALLTRDDDRNVPPDERAALANNNKAELFISLHANASFRKSVSGATIFTAEFGEREPITGRTSESTSLPAPERVPSFGGSMRDLELVPWNLAQLRHVDASAGFAKLVQQLFQDHVPLSPHPIAQAPLRVLESANMPAVLIEMGYLSNPAQEKQLVGNDFQTAIVQALAEAIARMRDTTAATTGAK
jgi:N-acetylmuramoyl-L-alanine amidase